MACTDEEVALVVVDVDFPVGHSEQQDLAIGRPGHVRQLDPLQLLPPDPVSCGRSTQRLLEPDQTETTGA